MISTIMKVISNKDGDLVSQFDIINENDIPVPEWLFILPPPIRDTPHQKMVFNNHTDANKGKIKRFLYLQDIFGFCKTFKKVTKNLGFHLLLKTNDLHDIIYTSMDDDIIVTIKYLYLFVPNSIPSVETQLMFKETTQNNYKISFDEWYTERRILSDMIIQHDIGSAQQVNSPKCLICAHQTKETKGEPLLNPFISYPDIKTKYPIEIIDLRHQLDQIRPKKNSLFQDYGADPDNARLDCF